MDFKSILFLNPEDRINIDTQEEPAFFVDLNLDQIISAITLGKQGYNLVPFFYTPLKDLDAIYYRQEIMREFENTVLFESIQSFAKKMRLMREHLNQAEELYYPLQKESWFLDAVEIYCYAVNDLYDELSQMDLKSRGFIAFRTYLSDYVNSPQFSSLVAETAILKADLSEIKYSILIKGNTIKVRNYETEIDYSAEVDRTFEKFKQGAVKDYKVQFSEPHGMNHIEAKILYFVALLFPDIFKNLDNFYAQNSEYLDEMIGTFDREVQFYISYLEFIAIFKRAGLRFCQPGIAIDFKEVEDLDGFDLALAYKLVPKRLPIVCNDFSLKHKERILVVSGPNQGGKTTFARTFGQLHYLANLGCHVPGTEARLILFDRLFTHFEKEEDLSDLSGKLQDDLVRIHGILEEATPNSIIIMNEIFTSTTLSDAILLSQKVMDKIIQLDLLCVWVTFIEELASYSEKTVSMVSTVLPENPEKRTYKIIRRPADGLAYALSIAEKYHLTYKQLQERFKV